MQPLKTEVVFSTPFFDLLAKTMKADELPYYSLRVPDFAVIVALTEDDRMLAVRQYRPSVERYTVELPSGLVDPGETPAEAAKRELLEETGYQAAEVELLGPMIPEAGRLTNQLWTCFARGVRKTAEAESGIEVVSYSMAELAQATMRGEFCHAPHVGSVLLARFHGKV
ncbi:MAG TPA: NUDIX hydrolase [Candidatus Sulfopaludibacter sp.]|jgi:ADP-ribose pyrophosphatase|nr:NUDIX hydrolase [Candidatus Sulfopaludibacter sp.]